MHQDVLLSRDPHSLQVLTSRTAIVSEPQLLSSCHAWPPALLQPSVWSRAAVRLPAQALPEPLSNTGAPYAAPSASMVWVQGPPRLGRRRVHGSRRASAGAGHAGTQPCRPA